MKPIKTLVLSASVLAIGLGASGLTNQAQAANSGSSEYVEYVDATLFGNAPVININNIAGDKHINSLNLKVQETEIEYTVATSVMCKKTNTHVTSAYAFFGPLAMGGFGNVVTSATLHEQSPMDFVDVKNDKIPESEQDQFVIPLNKIKNGSPALRVDPLAELEKARQAFNGTDLEFYSQDREIVLQRPISVAANCSKKTNPNKVSQGFETEMGAIKIKYNGDAALHNKAKLNAQLGQGGGGQGGFNAGPQPLKVTEMKFQPNMPHHIGACPGSKTIRVFFSGQGEGDVKIRINDGGNTIHQSGNIPFDASNGQHHYDFEMDAPAVSKFDLNKTFKHDLKVHVVAKDDDEQVWPTNYQLKDQAEWKRRCTPQLNGQIGGGMNGGIGGYDNGGNAPDMGKIQTKPTRGSLDKAVPIEPTPRPARAPLN